MRKFVPCLLTGLLLKATALMAGQVLFVSDFGGGGTNGWKNVPLFKGATDYQVVCEGTNCFLHANSENACSAFTARLKFSPPRKLLLRWQWRVPGVNTNASERDLKRFDHAARVFVAFDTFIGPPRTLNYFWANTEPAGAFLEHPMTGRAKIICVESGNARAGHWVAEERDVTADWLRAFPGRKMPDIVAVGVITDSDSLGTALAADYADMELIAE